MFNCPICGSKTRIKDGRFIENKFIRCRICHSCEHRFYTQEILMDYLEGNNELNKYWRKDNGIKTG